jgi:hypothetical protein
MQTKKVPDFAIGCPTINTSPVQMRSFYALDCHTSGM